MLGDKHVQVTETYDPDGIPTTGQKAGTAENREAMRRLGKQQVFKRNFGFLSIFDFALILMSTWEALPVTIALALGNGGPSGVLYTYLVAYAGFVLIVASLAEMASMAPTSGGQYHWLSVLGYLIGVTISSFLAGAIIQGLIVLGNPATYIYERWHGTMIAMCITVCIAVFNIFPAKHLPLVAGVILILHFAGWIAIVVPLWVLGPRRPHSGVWNTFSDAGCNNQGLACMIGFITSAGSFTGGDAAAHMFAFARDKVSPANQWISRVPPGYDIPVNGIIVSALIACILHCINIGSAIAFQTILSIGAVSLLTSYMASVGCITWRRLKGMPLLETKFSLEKWDSAVNLASLVFLVVVLVFSFLPPIPNPPADSMNWVIVVYVAVLGFAGIYYVVSARHHYYGPIEYTRKSD